MVACKRSFSKQHAVRDFRRLLAQLHRDPLLRNACPADCWLSSKLGYKLRDQLSDPLTLVSGALPEWCECLMFGARFLYPFDLRQLYFRCTAFGPARAVAWLKQQQPRAFDPVGALKVTPHGRLQTIFLAGLRFQTDGAALQVTRQGGCGCSPTTP